MEKKNSSLFRMETDIASRREKIKHEIFDHGLRVFIEKDITELGTSAAEYFVAALKEKLKKKKNKDKVKIGLPFGSAANVFFEKLVPLLEKSNIELDRLHFVQTEGAFPMNPEHKYSFTHPLNEKFIKPLGIKEDQFTLIESEDETLDEILERLRTSTEKLDFVILGLNESGSICGLRREPKPGTVAIAGQMSSRELSLWEANNISDYGGERATEKWMEMFKKDRDQKFPNAQPPSHFISLGYRPIVDADELIILSGGEQKAQATKMAVEGSSAYLIDVHGSEKKIVRKRELRSSASLSISLRDKLKKGLSVIFATRAAVLTADKNLQKDFIYV